MKHLIDSGVTSQTLNINNVESYLFFKKKVSFSLERAFAVNFPLRARNLRENHVCLFKILFLCIIFISFLFPVYNLVLLDIQPKYAFINGTNTTLHLCNVPDQSKKLYIDLTIFFVSSTLAIPFLGK